MSKLVWDASGERFFEAGVDRGVLYLDQFNGVAWNGLTGVEETTDNTATPYFQDGVPFTTVQSTGAFEAKLTAYTYPEEFELYQGTMLIRNGLLADGQPPKPFGLSYRSRLGNDLDGVDHGYLIHLLYNVTAIAEESEYVSIGDKLEPVEFSWGLGTIPEDVSGYRPTSHVILDSRLLSPSLLHTLEEILYGSSTTPASLPPLAELIETVASEMFVVVSHGDGTWTVEGPDDLIAIGGDGTFQITGIDGVFFGEGLFQISSTEWP